MTTQRIAAGVEYQGTAYAGWQRQPHAPSVQAEVERALSVVANDRVSVVCAGRTDTGVHAFAQVIHFDVVCERTPRQWLLGANSNLPGDISLTWVQPVTDDFHARFSAHSRRYQYLIHVGSARSGLWAGRVTECHRDLDLQRMRMAAGLLVGRHDFNAYRAVACQAHSSIRNLRVLDIHCQLPWFSIEVEANGFLHHMVRNIAGVLMAIGSGEREPQWAGEVLAGRDRRAGGITAPATGLYFLGPEYDEQFAIPEPANRGIWGLIGSKS